MNRFEQMSRIRKVLLLLAVFLLLLVFMEIAAYGIAVNVLDAQTAGRFRNSFHPLFTGRALLEEDSPDRRSASYFQGGNQYDPWYGHRVKRARRFTNRSGFLHDGKPDRDLRVKQENVYRIFLLGGSTVAGHNIRDDETISAQLEKYLNTSSRTFAYEVVNAGVQGYYSPQELAYLQFEIMYFKPDMVIAFDGYNDLDRNAVLRPGEAEPEYARYHWSPYHLYLYRFMETPDSSGDVHLRIPARLQIWRYLYLPGLLANLGGPDLLATWGSATAWAGDEAEPDRVGLLRARYPQVKDSAFRPVVETLGPSLDSRQWLSEAQIIDLPGEEITGEGIQRYTNNLAFMKAACRAADVEFLGVLQPFLLPDLKVFSPEERLWADSKWVWWAQNSRINYRKMMESQIRVTRSELADKLGDSFMDFSGLFSNTLETAYVDWVHYNADGTRIIAEHLGDRILAILNR